jgi:uncharacterized membrane protein HdeD (DUF308 family)
MTDPQNRPVGQQPGAGPNKTGASSGAGASSASGTSMPGQTGNITTEARETATSHNVPPQSGKQPVYGRSRASRDQPGGAAAYGTGGAMMSKAASLSWGAVLLGGLCMIAAGIALLVWPHVTLTIVALIIGAALVVSGVMRLWEGFTADDKTGGRRAASVVIGLLAVVAGVYCLRHHALSIFLVAFVVGLYFIVHGISEIGVGGSAQVPGRGLRVALGIFSIAAGIIMIVWPSLTLVLLLTIVGAWLCFYGVVLSALAFGLRKAAKSMKAASHGSMAADDERLAMSGAGGVRR